MKEKEVEVQEKKKSSWNAILNVLLVIILLAGIALLAYPSISDYSNRVHQTRAIVKYADYVKEVDDETLEQAILAAQEYNARLRESSNPLAFYREHQAEYDNLLNLDGTNIMGYIDIPTINTSLPIYHTTEESVLQVAVGHLEWTSLPVGGESTHSVLSGHRGLPSARLFTDLDQMEVGDVFSIHIYKETLYYSVDNISVVLPEEASGLVPTTGEDYCTLLTCTPYGVNSHRLLVRGSRIYPETDVGDIAGDAQEYSTMLVSGVLGGSVILVFVVVYWHRNRKLQDDEGEIVD